MTFEDWTRVVDQARANGVRTIQFIGGEPLLYRRLPELITRALSMRIDVEVYSNLVHVTPAMWTTLDQQGVRVATSFYSDDPAQHLAITGRNTLARTQANIVEAVRRGIPLRAGIIDLGGNQRVQQAKDLLAELRVTDVGIDRMRLLGRPARGACDASQLCGRCGDGVAAILPDGSVAPCPLSRWLSAGSVRCQPLDELAVQVRQMAAQAIGPLPVDACSPPCEPQCNPGCNPGVDSPGGGDGCQPKMNCNPNSSCKPKDPCRPDVSCKPR